MSKKTPFTPLGLTWDEYLSLVLTEAASGHIRWDEDIFMGPGVCAGCLADLAGFADGTKPDCFPSTHGRAATFAEVVDTFRGE